MSRIYKKITRCRICGNTDLQPILSLGNQYLTGIFPKIKKQIVPSGPLELVKCNEKTKKDSCGLLQLGHSYNLEKLYGSGYGYRSGLNNSMVRHLQEKVKKILDYKILSPGDLVIDIGSNDATLLKAYPRKGLILAGIDPIGMGLKKYYPKNIHFIPEFFSIKAIKNKFGSKKAKVVTSIAMFYDLEQPMAFMKQVYDILDDGGIWVLEQSYMPTMLEINGYDVICHEHLEYYSLKQIKWMTGQVGFKIVDVELNEVNGGSFSITLSKSDRVIKKRSSRVEKILAEEKNKKLHLLKPYQDFKKNIYKHRRELRKIIKKIKKEGKEIIGYGASTKGNVILQFCQFTRNDIPWMAEINEDKFGCYTPGTKIPIISEKQARVKKPDYMLVLPWHFRENIIKREKKYLEKGGCLLMPLPKIELIRC